MYIRIYRYMYMHTCTHKILKVSVLGPMPLVRSVQEASALHTLNPCNPPLTAQDEVSTRKVHVDIVDALALPWASTSPKSLISQGLWAQKP